MLASLNLPKTLPVGTADAGSFFSNKVLEAVDYGVRHFHRLGLRSQLNWTQI